MINKHRLGTALPVLNTHPEFYILYKNRLFTSIYSTSSLMYSGRMKKRLTHCPFMQFPRLLQRMCVRGGDCREKPNKVPVKKKKVKQLVMIFLTHMDVIILDA